MSVCLCVCLCVCVCVAVCGCVSADFLDIFLEAFVVFIQFFYLHVHIYFQKSSRGPPLFYRTSGQRGFEANVIFNHGYLFITVSTLFFSILLPLEAFGLYFSLFTSLMLNVFI